MIYKMPTSCHQHWRVRVSLGSKFWHSIIHKLDREDAKQPKFGPHSDMATRSYQCHTRRSPLCSHKYNDKLIGSVEDYFFIWFRLHPDRRFLFNFFGKSLARASQFIIWRLIAIFFCSAEFASWVCQLSLPAEQPDSERFFVLLSVQNF